MCLTAATRGRLKIAKTRHSKFITCVEVLLKKWTMRLCKLSHVHSLLRLFFHARSRVSRLRTIGPTGESSLSRNVAPPRVCSDRSAERDAKHAGVSSMTRVHARTHARRVCVACVHVTRVRAATRCVVVPPTKRKATGRSPRLPFGTGNQRAMATFLHTSALHTTHPELHPEPYGECTPWTGINGLAGTFNCHEWEPPSPRPFY